MQLASKSKRQCGPASSAPFPAFDVRRSTFDVSFLQTGHAALVELIRDAIRLRGPVPFPWFMEQALYHPEHGYYSSGRAAIGHAGDYYTSVSVGPLFGRLMAEQFAEMWEVLGRPAMFDLIEQGAHGGEFARDVLEALQRHHPAVFETARYQIIEPFPVLRSRQITTLAEFSQHVSWRNSLTDLSSFQGIHFSNELIDAFPVHLVKWTGHEWLEQHVTEGGDAFRFVDLPLTTTELATAVQKIPLPLPVGYETEINLAAQQWITDVSSKLERGFVLAVDYGYPRDEFYAPHRATGTLRSYAKHRVVASPLEAVGEADITAHVEWSGLSGQAETCGLRVLGFTDQHHSITGLLAGPLQQEFAAGVDPKRARALQTLLHPNHLGMKFQFLVLAKNIAVAEAALSGLRFARG